MLNKQNVFSTKRGIYRKKGGKKRRNQKLELLCHKDRSAHIKPRFGFKRMAGKVAQKMFDRNFYKSLSKALKNAK